MHRLGRTAGNDNQTTCWFRWAPSLAPASDDIDADNDGVMSTQYEAIVDLSHGLSRLLGRQMPMMATYEVSEVVVALENVDDIDDNDEGSAFYGYLDYYEPTQHRIDALQLGRAVEKHYEGSEVDADSFLLSTQKDYSGFRFSYGDANAQDSNGTGAEVAFPTAASFAGVGNVWAMEPIFQLYNTMQVGNAGDQHDNMLWDNRRCGRPDRVRWSCGVQQQGSAASDEYFPEFMDSGNIIPSGGASVLGGLMKLKVVGSSVNPPGAVDDDYKVWIGVTVKGWRSF